MASVDADLTDIPPVEPPDIPADPTAVWPSLRPIGAKPGLREYLQDLWQRRDFAREVPLAELQAQNQDTVLGQLWHLLNPLLLVGVYYLIFDVILDVGERGGVTNFIAFLLIGVMGFNYTRTAVQSGARMIVKNRKLVQSISFPRAILPISAMIGETVAHAYALVVMFLILPLTGVRPSWTWLLVFPIVALQAAFTLGAAMFTARVTFHFRDIQQVLPYLLRLWFYASGVLFPVTSRFEGLTPTMEFILKLNPMWALLEIARDAFMYGRVSPKVWALATVWSIGVLMFGFWYFRRAESEYGRV